MFLELLPVALHFFWGDTHSGCFLFSCTGYIRLASVESGRFFHSLWNKCSPAHLHDAISYSRSVPKFGVRIAGTSEFQWVLVADDRQTGGNTSARGHFVYSWWWCRHAYVAVTKIFERKRQLSAGAIVCCNSVSIMFSRGIKILMLGWCTYEQAV